LGNDPIADWKAIWLNIGLVLRIAPLFLRIAGGFPYDPIFSAAAPA